MFKKTLAALLISTFSLTTFATGSTQDEPVVVSVGKPYSTVPQTQEVAVTPKCDYIDMDEGYHEPIKVKHVCCKLSGAYALKDVLAKLVSGTVLRTLPMDARSESIFSTGCTKDLSTLNIELKLKVTYLPL